MALLIIAIINIGYKLKIKSWLVFLLLNNIRVVEIQVSKNWKNSILFD